MKTTTTAALLLALLALTGCSTPSATTPTTTPQPEAKRETCQSNLALQAVGAKDQDKPADAGRVCVKHS